MTASQPKCIECAHLRFDEESTGRTRPYCAACRKVLPANVTSRPACDEFKAPPAPEYWGP